MAAVALPQQHFHAVRDEQLMDTRTPSPIRRMDTSEEVEPQYKPDLSAEIAMLSTKLVNAINYQTNLDDSLQQTRHELDQNRQELARVRAEKQHIDDLVSKGILVRKSEVDQTIAKLKADLASERAAREAADRSRKQTEGELENLTSALFEEANTMVAAARKDTEAVERRNSQLKGQLRDTDLLLASQQEQLQDLKSTIEALQNDQTSTRDPSMPSTPITAHAAILEAQQLASNDPSAPEFSPEHPLHFAQLLAPVLRHDTAAYTEFQDLLVLARRLGAHSRTNSNNAGQHNSLSQTSLSAAASSSPNLPGSFSFGGSSSPSSSTYSPSSSSVPALKETKFYKRVLSEDIEPALRLDLAPGLSFLSRRTVQGALLQGTLAVEPFPQNKHYFACALCGESRRAEPYIRKYRFRNSEEDTVPKPLCDYCVGRLRSAGDFVGFLRMVRDGLWKCDSEEDQTAAWEESVRLRERMFWARVGGGVVPCLPQTAQKTMPSSPSTTTAANNIRPSLGSIPESDSADAATRRIPTQDAEVSESDDDRRPSALSRAIVNISSGATATATPDARPAENASTSSVNLAAGFSTPPPSQQQEASHETVTSEMDLDESAPSAPASGSDSEAEVQIPEASNEVKRGSDATQYSTDRARNSTSSQRTLGAASEATNSTSSVRRSEERPKLPSRDSQTSQRSSLNDRKPSSVLARVRAMESSKQGPQDAST